MRRTTTIDTSWVAAPGDTDDGTARSDVCAGYARDATLLTITRRTGISPVAVGPPAPPLDRGDDPLGWHPLPTVPPLGMRRARRLDLEAPDEPGSPHRFDVAFRDSHVDGDGNETVMHEYRVTGDIEADGRLLAIRGQARVLPWRECPEAVGGAERLVGRPVQGLRRFVRQTFVGTSTCTHLNDTLRGLADLEHLLALLADAET